MKQSIRDDDDRRPGAGVALGAAELAALLDQRVEPRRRVALLGRIASSVDELEVLADTAWLVHDLRKR